MESVVGIPGKITIEYDDITWSNREYSGTLPNNFEAELRIFRRSSLWFSEYITIGELLVQAERWIIENNLPRFDYTSLDTDDNPIMSIVRHPAIGCWRMESKDQIFEDAYDLSTTEIHTVLNQLIQSIYNSVRMHFGNISIKW